MVVNSTPGWHDYDEASTAESGYALNRNRALLGQMTCVPLNQFARLCAERKQTAQIESVAAHSTRAASVEEGDFICGKTVIGL